MRGLAVIPALVLAAAACGDDGTSNGGGPSRDDAAVYATVIDHFAADVPAAEDGSAPVAFVDGLDEESVPIDVQVAVVADLEDDVQVRFIDAPEEAIDDGTEGSPVRNGGILLRLGAPVGRDDQVEVDVERYLDADDVARYRLVLTGDDGSWRVGDDPEELPVPEPQADDDAEAAPSAPAGEALSPTGPQGAASPT